MGGSRDLIAHKMVARELMMIRILLHFSYTTATTFIRGDENDVNVRTDVLPKVMIIPKYVPSHRER